MESGVSILFALVPVVLASAGSTGSTGKRVEQIVEHWKWKNYWEGATELGMKYRPGRQFDALLFWHENESEPGVGYCSKDLGICQFYPNLLWSVPPFEETFSGGDDNETAFHRFLDNSFGETPWTVRLRGVGPPSEIDSRPKKLNKSDYRAVKTSITLPSLDPPEAIRERRRRPVAETDALVATLNCLADQPGCKVHMMIPFYGSDDPNIPVFRQCTRCQNERPMIIFMNLIDGKWWHGATNFTDSPDLVQRTKRQIEKALMLEVRR